MKRVLTYRLIGEPEYDKDRKRKWRVPCYCLETEHMAWVLYNDMEHPLIRTMKDKVVRAAAQRKWERYGKHEFMA
ncbi:hypothetical protein [Mitsuokella jalaludinii]|uniref:hypothetical protein n=1 Tax=Mitsuokella jalaludinii TaxID=187979 RepID=UPI00307AB337